LLLIHGAPSLRAGDIVLFQPPLEHPTDAPRQRRLRLLLSFYREDGALPRIAQSPEQLTEELGLPTRRGLVHARFWDELAPIASSLVVEQEVEVAAERYRLVRRGE
jgi:hypothetical protein